MASSDRRVVVIGAGIGGLTTAALLLQAGFHVTVLESQTYAGGSAGTFYHKGFRFDAGATLAGGFADGGPHARLAQLLDLQWPVTPVDPAWVVHLPQGKAVTQWTDEETWAAERARAFPGTEAFWQTQTRLADVSWDLSSRPFPWPPASARDWVTLATALRPRTFKALPYLFKTVADLAPEGHQDFSTFLDAQLLIAAQTTAVHAHALYGSAALDLPRRGVNHVHGGIGTLAETLVNWIREHGGVVRFRHEVTGVDMSNGRAVGVKTKRGLYEPCDWLVANLTPWALHGLVGGHAPESLTREVQQRQPTWGAFVLYLGLENARLPQDIAGHHQVIVDSQKPLGEGNSVFISLSAPSDAARAPAGYRAATLSTHTAVAPWWELRRRTREDGYLERREEYTQRLLDAAERAIPGVRNAARLILPGTPVTFEFYTRRPLGMVGGFPQTSLFNARGPGTGLTNVRLVGDSIFPGQSTAGVTLGGMRVATEIAGASRRIIVPAPSLRTRPWQRA